MTDRAGTSAVRAVADRTERDGPSWFEHLEPARTRVSIEGVVRRTRCDLVRLDLSDGRHSASVLAKIRHSSHGAPVGAGRPTLMAATPLPDRDLADLEFAGLGMVATTGRRAVRPLACLPEHAAIVMDHMALPSLRRVLVRGSRLNGPRRKPVPEAGWASAGDWLRRFHSADPVDTATVARNTTRAGVIPLYSAYAGHIAGRGGDASAMARLAAAAADLAERHLPGELPLVVGHGDFAPRNILVDPDGAVAVIDPMPRWRVPQYEDLCRLVVGVRCLGLQTASRGMAFAPAQLDRWEGLFLSGYYGAGAVPVDALRAYGLLILLDKWSASAATVRDPLRRGWFDRHFRREAARLLDPTRWAAGRRS